MCRKYFRRQVRNGFEPTQIKMTHFRLFLPVPYTAYPWTWSYDNQNGGSFNPWSWVIQWKISVIARIDSVTFFGRTIALPHDVVIDWLNEYSWHLTPAFDRSTALNCLRAWTQLICVLFLPVQSFLFTLLIVRVTAVCCILNCRYSEVNLKSPWKRLDHCLVFQI